MKTLFHSYSWILYININNFHNLIKLRNKLVFVSYKTFISNKQNVKLFKSLTYAFHLIDLLSFCFISKTFQASNEVIDSKTK
jgi:hypothetical protein